VPKERVTKRGGEDARGEKKMCSSPEGGSEGRLCVVLPQGQFKARFQAKENGAEKKKTPSPAQEARGGGGGVQNVKSSYGLPSTRQKKIGPNGPRSTESGWGGNGKRQDREWEESINYTEPGCQ